MIDAVGLDRGIKTRLVLGCVGAVRLLAGRYLVVLTSCELSGFLRGDGVFKATGFDVIECAVPNAVASLSPQRRRDEKQYLHLLRASLRSTKHLYFSSGYDLTRNCQQQQRDWEMAVKNQAAARNTTTPGPFYVRNLSGKAGRDGLFSNQRGSRPGTVLPVPVPRWRVADKMFCWNRHAGATLITAVLSETSEDVGTTDSMMIR